MIPCVPVFDYLSSPRICCYIASNIAFLNAHWIACIEETLLLGSLTEIIGNNTRLADCHHVDLVYFKDLVHLLHRKNNASIKWNSGARKARARTAWCNRNMLSIRKFHQLCNLFFVLGSD